MYQLSSVELTNKSDECKLERICSWHRDAPHQLHTRVTCMCVWVQQECLEYLYLGPVPALSLLLGVAGDVVTHNKTTTDRLRSAVCTGTIGSDNGQVLCIAIKPKRSRIRWKRDVAVNYEKDGQFLVFNGFIQICSVHQDYDPLTRNRHPCARHFFVQVTLFYVKVML